MGIPVVNASAVVMCSHAGTAHAAAPNPRVMVGGAPVVTLSSPYVVAGCALTGTPAPPCVTGQVVSGSTRVLAGGVPLVLASSQSVCVPTGTPLMIVTTQPQVTAT
jgi:hypothetical protein